MEDEEDEKENNIQVQKSQHHQSSAKCKNVLSTNLQGGGSNIPDSSSCTKSISGKEIVLDLEDGNLLLDNDHGDNLTTACQNQQQQKKRKAKSIDRHPDKWTSTIQKKRRTEGKSYEGRKIVKSNGSLINKKVYKAGRSLKEHCLCKIGSKSKFCHEFSADDREKEFNQFWQEIKDWEGRKIFIRSLVDVKEPQRNSTSSMVKESTFIFKLSKNGEKKRVCKKLFLNTFDIGSGQVYSWLQNKSTKSPTQPAAPRVKTYKEGQKKANLKSFLLSLPKVESHYCRADTTRLYLESTFKSKADLYRVYGDYCKTNNFQKASKFVLHRLLKSLKISLYIPKKDMCNVCNDYKMNKNDEKKKSIYDMHIIRKNCAREEKIEDKKKCKKQNCTTLTVDLQQVLLSPKLNVNANYFKQKISCHNYTVFNLNNSHVCCYFWNESEGDVKASSFSSCLVNYLENYCNLENDKEIIIYSDGCPAQNRNSTLSNALSQFSMRTNTTVLQKYLEKGHTYMECDSVHGMIEKKLKKTEIHIPEDYKNVIECSRLTSPYECKVVDHSFFIDYTDLNNFGYTDIRPGRKAGDPCVTDIRVLQYKPDGKVYYKLNFSDQFKELPNVSKNIAQAVQSRPLYNNQLTIATSKWKDLQELKIHIPEAKRKFYDNLSHAAKKNV